MTGEAVRSVAVIGGGVAGILSAYLLSQRYHVTLFEKNSYVGGHTNTVLVSDGPDAGRAVDTGFIVLNDTTYPTLHRFFAKLNVPVRFTDMSFSFWDRRTGFQYGSRNLNHLFAQRRNIFNLRFLRMISDVRRFWDAAAGDLTRNELGTETLSQWLQRHRLSGGIVEDYLVPISAAIWSSPAKSLRDFPMVTFLNFFKNHGLLKYFAQPRWQTVVGGSSAYVKAFLREFKGEVRKGSPVVEVQRNADGVEITTTDGKSRYDQVVFACHADEVLGLLPQRSPEEDRLFGAWRYQLNKTYLHTDRSFLPPLRRAWASWNYVREEAESGEEPVSVTYHMNNLQGFQSNREYCVTLNPRRAIDPSAIIRVISYHHPVYTPEAMQSQGGIAQLQGKNRTWYAGSYFGFGFHEDAARSAANVARLLGVDDL